MTIYVDRNFICHLTAAEDRTAVETDAFDGKCDGYIDGFRFVPYG